MIAICPSDYALLSSGLEDIYNVARGSDRESTAPYSLSLP